ncbi:MAG: SUMF1/EgtB/PvdO family nonheme iron enzyme [Alphaproteobacteria bacterium]|nr:SUMF1/EgtB/PvdO family nonheme iron enzyme [Alphaproteobacteria bacterium]
MADVFISYKREDRERIAPLARALEARGYTVWWDLELVPSQKFERQIKRELDAAKCLIVVWTDRSIADDGMYVSEWVQIEANSGDQRGILLPVQLDAGRTHWRHGQNQFAALNGWTGDETASGFQDLLKGVELHAGTRARPQDVELIAWQQAERMETADGFKRFLEAYPQSRFADIARGRIAELEEVAAWKALGAAPTIAALAAFLRRFPAGRFADDAEAKIRAMELASARAATPSQAPPAASERLPPPRSQPERMPEPASPAAGLPKWLIPAGAAGLALVALLAWSPWNRTNPPTAETPPIVAEASAPKADGPAPSSASPAAPVETRPETMPPLTEGAATPPPEPARAQTPESGPPVAAPSIPLPDMVRIPGQNFEAGRYEVTFAEWDACVAGGGCNGHRPSDEGWGRGRRPVINVSWNDAQAYVQWLSERTGRRYRLLTSTEWEIAARAGTTTEYSWGDDPPVCDQSARNGANFRDCTDDRTRPVGSFQPNGFGLYDVHGNVWEWVQEGDGSLRVLRGGAWSLYPQYLRSAGRLRDIPTVRSSLWGFRLARTL